jgi:hypothetical protein
VRKIRFAKEAGGHRYLLAIPAAGLNEIYRTETAPAPNMHMAEMAPAPKD